MKMLIERLLVGSKSVAPANHQVALPNDFQAQVNFNSPIGAPDRRLVGRSPGVAGWRLANEIEGRPNAMDRAARWKDR
jgi:hypothetical protein